MAFLVCKSCKLEKDADQFLWNGRKGSTRVRFCNECASRNMLRYWSTRMVGRKPDEFSDAGD